MARDYEEIVSNDCSQVTDMSQVASTSVGRNKPIDNKVVNTKLQPQYSYNTDMTRCTNCDDMLQTRNMKPLPVDFCQPSFDFFTDLYWIWCLLSDNSGSDKSSQTDSRIWTT